MASSADAATDQIWSAQAGHVRVRVDPTEDGGATVRVAGELDVAGAPLIDDALQMVPAARRRDVRLDLRAVSFCDCAGLNAFIAGDAMLRAAGGRLTLIRPSAPVRRLLSLTEIDRFLGGPAEG